jgi:hypothetical protein
MTHNQMPVDFMAIVREIGEDVGRDRKRPYPLRGKRAESIRNKRSSLRDALRTIMQDRVAHIIHMMKLSEHRLQLLPFRSFDQASVGQSTQKAGCCFNPRSGKECFRDRMSRLSVIGERVKDRSLNLSESLDERAESEPVFLETRFTLLGSRRVDRSVVVEAAQAA